ncbi:MAG: hypothetical protein E7321_08935 [Clostridiales bacterium]|nr:hypothetical protein [Clostridiales bacterium]
MKTTTSKGQVFEASRALVSVRDSNRLMMDVMDARSISEVAADFEGVETLTQEDAQHVEHAYRGFTELAAISRNDSDGSLRITMKKPKHKEG